MTNHSHAKSDEATILRRVEDLLRQMTLKEKVSLLSGKDSWNTMPLERLGIPSIVMTDGPNGVRADREDFGRPAGPTTAFPTGLSMGATWNPDLIRLAAEAMAEETLAMGCDILLGPCVNIVRAPLGGRNFEMYSEDPYLSGKLAVAWVDGLQSKGVGASLKHFAANNQEIERFRSSSEVDERTLREIYFPAFETCVKETQPWTVMCAYNRINGVYASQNGYLMNKVLRSEWNFKGFVVSDWGANHTTVESLEGGLDMEMPGPAKYYGKLLSEAVYNWQIDERTIDDAVRRILRIIILSGRMDDPRPVGSVNTPQHQAVARRVAEEAITLLKNEGNILPIDLAKVRTIAAIGPNAADLTTGGGGSSYIRPPYKVTPLEGLQACIIDRAKIGYEQGCDNFNIPPVIQPEWLSLPGSSEPGMQGEYFANVKLAGEPAHLRTETSPDFWWFSNSPIPEIPVERFSARWTSDLRAPASGYYILQLSNSGVCRLTLDGELLFDSAAPNHDKFEEGVNIRLNQVELEANKPYRLQIDFAKYEGQEYAHLRLGMVTAPSAAEDERIECAVDLAKNSDLAIVFAGMPGGYETEGLDRPNMELPNRQDELIRAVANANPNTVVVLNAASPVSMPWIEKVAAVLLAYFPGQEGGNAIARVLTGAVNPSGKLPISYPKRLEDNPAFENTAYPGDREINYGEGIFVGYRYYDHRDTAPLFPFGYGLSYTTFEYSNLQVSKSVMPGESVQVSFDVTNTGKVAGKEIAQVYVGDLQCSVPRPPKELKAFQKVELRPGETKTLAFTLGPRALSFYDPVRAAWVAETGEFEVLVGGSSRDICLTGRFSLEP